MAVVWQQTVTPWNTNSNGGSVASGSFTPTMGDLLLSFAMDVGSTVASLSFSGSGTGTWTQLSPPGNYGDGGSKTHGLGYNPNCSGAAQTASVGTNTGDNTILGWCWEYSGASTISSVSGVARAAPGTGSGAITGTGVLVPTGAILLAMCMDVSVNSPTFSSPSGTNRGNSNNDGLGFCITEYAGAGASITPSFTTSLGSDTYVVLQVLMSPPAANTPPQLALLGVGH